MGDEKVELWQGLSGPCSKTPLEGVYQNVWILVAASRKGPCEKGEVLSGVRRLYIWVKF